MQLPGGREGQGLREQEEKKKGTREQMAREQKTREQEARKQKARGQEAREQKAREQEAREQAVREKKGRFAKLVELRELVDREKKASLEDRRWEFSQARSRWKKTILQV